MKNLHISDDVRGDLKKLNPDQRKEILRVAGADHPTPAGPPWKHGKGKMIYQAPPAKYEDK